VLEAIDQERSSKMLASIQLAPLRSTAKNTATVTTAISTAIDTEGMKMMMKKKKRRQQQKQKQNQSGGGGSGACSPTLHLTTLSFAALEHQRSAGLSTKKERKNTSTCTYLCIERYNGIV